MMVPMGMTHILDFWVILILLTGMWLFRDPRQARLGNLAAAFSLLAALILVLVRHRILNTDIVPIALVGGSVFGYVAARKVGMIQMPAMVAIQNGTGGAAALLVSLVELMRSGVAADPVRGTSGVVGLVIGSLTFSGSIVAAAKLANKMRQASGKLPAHHFLSALTALAILVVIIASFFLTGQTARYLYPGLIALSLLYGGLLSIRVGGADMPVMISFLNAMTGLAAALCGMALGNRLLIAFGATVAASGTILTYLMCKAMNRDLFRILAPRPVNEKTVPVRQPSMIAAADSPAAAVIPSMSPTETFRRAVRLMAEARKVIVVPGYGMAIAKAQTEVVKLSERLMARGKVVRYAIHPVAGRMPGHMNVLLAEAGVDYDMLIEMEMINPDFPNTDLVLVVGACDVVNPAAIEVEGTPISGMPVLMVHRSKQVVCCNFDDKPGYSGVDNPLYEKDNTLLIPGDAKATIRQLLNAL